MNFIYFLYIYTVKRTKNEDFYIVFRYSRKLKEAGVNMICVAIGKPRFIAGIPQMLNVCPTRYMVSGPCSHDEYLKLYDRILASQDANQVVKQIEMLSGGKDVALCCYEKPGDFCHRHILAKWITENTGIEITEFGVVEKKEPNYEQASLF